MSDTPSYVPARTSTASGELQDWRGREPSVPVSALRALLAYCRRQNSSIFSLHNLERNAYGDCADRLAALCDQAEAKV
jgi:hypothetical protein